MFNFAILFVNLPQVMKVRINQLFTSREVTAHGIEDP
jgi:hypothetical protein